MKLFGLKEKDMRKFFHRERTSDAVILGTIKSIEQHHLSRFDENGNPIQHRPHPNVKDTMFDVPRTVK